MRKVQELRLVAFGDTSKGNLNFLPRNRVLSEISRVERADKDTSVSESLRSTLTIAGNVKTPHGVLVMGLFRLAFICFKRT